MTPAAFNFLKMECYPYFLLIISIVLSSNTIMIISCSCFSASFYGASYISYPLQEAKGLTDINLKFRTHLSDALLLLAAGKTDYCMVRTEKDSSSYKVIILPC